MTEQSPAEAIFFAALKRPAAERNAYLDGACGEDKNLRQRVERLLATHPQVGSFLAQPALGAEAETAPPASTQADRIIAGRYKLLQPIGEGGMGSVWMAQQTSPVTRLVAVKLIKAGMDSGAFLARFEAERQALALMDHPNIAKVLDGGTTEDGRPYFVMELVKGTPITRYCDEHRLPLRGRLELFVAVCQALQHAHQKGIVHRDLKPSNVLVAPYDGTPIPKVIDFGVAKAMGPRLTERTMFTEFGAIIGTLQYMSPEQAELNNLDIDTRSDIYSLGVLLYELLTGTTPLDMDRLRGAAIAAVLMAIHEEEPPRPSTRLTQATDSLPSIAAQRQTEPARLSKLLRGELDWIVMKALEKDRKRRYETANGLARDLERYLHDEVVEARPPTAGYRLRKFTRKHRTVLTAAATTVLMLLAGIAVSAWQAVRATRAERDTADALTVAEDRRQQADEQRKKAETLAASLAVDADLRYCQNGEVGFGLLRLAQTLRTAIPEHDRELRECVVLNIVAWGQQICPAIAALDHDGYRVDRAVLSPDGLTVLTLGRDGTARLWDSVTGKQRAVLGGALIWKNTGDLPLEKYVQFSNDGRTVLTLHAGHSAKASFNDWDVTDRTVRLWDVTSGRLRAETASHSLPICEIQLSKNNSLLVTTSSPSQWQSFQRNRWTTEGTTVFAWDAENGQFIRKLQVKGVPIRCAAVSPDGKCVVLPVWHSAEGGTMMIQVWFPHEGSPPRLLPGTKSHQSSKAYFSPSGKSAATVTTDAVCWWDTGAWKLQQKWLRTEGYEDFKDLPAFAHENIFLLAPREDALFQGAVAPRVFIRHLPEQIISSSKNECRVSPDGAWVAFDADEVYDCRSGERRALPRGRRFDAALRHFTDDGRFALFPNSFLADLAVEKKIGANVASRFLKSQNAWIGIDSHNALTILRKADAFLDAELLEKWCQVVTRRELDERGRYQKLDEATWEKRRQELALALETNARAEVLRAATTDRLYWLRQEIKDSSNPLPLLDRLIAAEPSWRNYSQRAQANFDKERWSEAARDEFEAARLAGDLYWFRGSPFAESIYQNSPDGDWRLGDSIVQKPGRPRAEYELALKWGEARWRAGVSGTDRFMNEQAIRFRGSGPLMLSLALFRLGRYADALAMLQKNDVPKFALAAGLLMSPWNLLVVDPRKTYVFKDADDMIVRAMCHHHLGQPREAAARLHFARELWRADKQQRLLNVGLTPEQLALLHEAERLIEGKARP